MARTTAARSGTKAGDKPSGRRGTRATRAESDDNGSVRERAQEEAASNRAAKAEANAILAAKVYELREEDEMSWGAIAEELGYGDGNQTGLLQFRFEEEYVRRNPRLRITAKTDAELGAKIRKARDADQLSWGKIMARTGLGLSRVRKLYEADGGTALGNRIGKGGRHPNTPAPKATKARAAKPAAAAKPAKAATSTRARKTRAR
jgi:hypothetical protein